MMARIPISTTAFCLIYIAAYFVAAESDVDWSPKYTVPKSVDEKLYDMAFTENEKVQREAMEDEERLATTEDPDAANDKRIRIQMYSRDSGEPTMYQDGALNKRMRLQSMKKRIRLQSLKKVIIKNVSDHTQFLVFKTSDKILEHGTYALSII